MVVSDAKNNQTSELARGGSQAPSPTQYDSDVAPKLDGRTSMAQYRKVAAQTKPTRNPRAEKAPYPGWGRTLTTLRNKVGEERIAKLPTLDKVRFEALDVPFNRLYVKGRLQVGTYISSDHTQDGAPVWAYLKTEQDKDVKAPNLMIVVEIDEGKERPRRLRMMNIENEMKKQKHIRFDPIFLEHGAPSQVKMYSLVKYYYMLAAEAGIGGFERHFIPFTREFATTMIRVCNLFGKRGASRKKTPKEIKKEEG